MSRNTNIPDQAEIAALPRWARVAFAARCARRVQPSFRAGRPKATQTRLKAFDTAVMVLERASADGTYDAAAYGAIEGADAAALVATVVYDICDAYDADDADAVRRDFKMLQSAAAGEGWTNDTPVPPEFFGPLWPQGVRQGLPAEEESSENCEVVFEIDVPLHASDEDIYDKAVELADRADALHRVYGGRGLKVKTLEVFEESQVRQGVPS